MAAPQNAPLTPFLTLDGGYFVSFTAVDPTTGAVVGAVVVTGASIAVDPVDTGPAPPAEPISPALLPV